MTTQKDCGDVASPWPGTILEVPLRDGIYFGPDGAVTSIVVGGKERQVLIVRP